jgi:two-component system NtrC family sensor kinase
VDRPKAGASAPAAPPQSPLASAATLADGERLQAELIQAQKMEAIGQLVSGVAHELNNPLAAIVAFSQLIRMDSRLPADLRHDADLLVQEAERTRRIVQNLLDFARQRPPERHLTPLRPLIKSVLDLQAYSIHAGRIEVELDIEPDVPAVPVDRAQLQQVLLNLTINAIQAIGTDGRGRLAIRVGTGMRDDGERVARIEIADDGPGVPPEHRDRLFVPFFTTREEREGTGLGLPVASGIVAAHGGTLRFEPGPGGRGATFIVELPVSAPVDDRAAAHERPKPGGARTRARVPASNGPRPRVLVLDDEPSIRRFLEKALEKAGYEAVLAADGREALAKLGEEPVAAVFCDHRMSGMSGTQVFEAITAIRPELARRFVFMSGDVLNAELRDFAETRDIRLLAKPFDVASVGRTVEELLASTGGQPRG